MKRFLIMALLMLSVNFMVSANESPKDPIENGTEMQVEMQTAEQVKVADLNEVISVECIHGHFDESLISKRNSNLIQLDKNKDYKISTKELTMLTMLPTPSGYWYCWNHCAQGGIISCDLGEWGGGSCSMEFIFEILP